VTALTTAVGEKLTEKASAGQGLAVAIAIKISSTEDLQQSLMQQQHVGFLILLVRLVKHNVNLPIESAQSREPMEVMDPSLAGLVRNPEIKFYPQ
jgi:hypothetical protein